MTHPHNPYERDEAPLGPKFVSLPNSGLFSRERFLITEDAHGLAIYARRLRRRLESKYAQDAIDQGSDFRNASIREIEQIEQEIAECKRLLTKP